MNECTLCSVKKKVATNINKSNSNLSNQNLISRVIFEKINKLERKKQPKSNVDEVIKKYSVVQVNGESKKISSASEALAEYELSFKEEQKLKLTPIKNYSDIDKIREKLWVAQDKTRYAEGEFKRLSDLEEPEDALLAVRLKVRKGFLNETNQSNEVGKVHETEEYYRERQFDPSECQAGTFRTITLGDGTKGIICKKHGEEKTSLQSKLVKKK